MMSLILLSYAHRFTFRNVRRIALSIGGVLAIASGTAFVRAQFVASAAWTEFTIMRRETSRSLVLNSSVQRVAFEAQRRDGSVATGSTEPARLGGETRTIS